MIMRTDYSFTATLILPFKEAEKEVRAALQKEKFGIISEIDIATKLKEKLGIDHPAHIILGACNPQIAYNALQDNMDVALALPCNVVLREDGGKTIVTALLPSIALKPFEGLNVQEASRTAEEALGRVFDALSKHIA
jgi:uncharacterized protein (DUF302 family)